ncbi:LysR family transcriptional regulator [Advenella sp. FME57]|uniref:LysR family transcriptional regulator n=1 Tax=Advenella sp. FME57 TaxID=2742604 RepID=UPI001866B7DC|nr:LysR family transcriptional regulator [Advenella sp. FME57]
MISKNFSGIVAFMKVAALGSFNAAAKDLGISPPAVSRSIQRLETQLNVRLLNRNTHSVSITTEGARFFDQCLPSIDHLVRVAADLKDAASSDAGSLRVSATVGYGRRCIAPLLSEFCVKHPDIQLEFELNDRMTDFFEEKIDIAIRNGRLEDSGIIARKIAPMRLIVCGSPDYFEKNGAPTSIEDLDRHKTIGFRLEDSGKIHDWEFFLNGSFYKHKILPHQIFNDPELVAQAARAGSGLAQIANYQADSLIAQGDLIAVLTQHIAEGRGHYICYSSRKQMPLRVKLFIDYLQSKLGF